MKIQYTRKNIVVPIAIAATFLLTGCADSMSFTEAADATPVGFLHGLWHGAILPVSWIVSLFSDTTAIYAIYNNGGWYDFGFIIGITVWAGGASQA